MRESSSSLPTASRLSLLLARHTRCSSQRLKLTGILESFQTKEYLDLTFHYVQLLSCIAPASALQRYGRVPPPLNYGAVAAPAARVAGTVAPRARDNARVLINSIYLCQALFEIFCFVILD